MKLSQARPYPHKRAEKLELDEPPTELLVNRLYLAVEGEGMTIGQPKWFLRTQGCSVGCKWCDSRQTWRFDTIMGEWPEYNHAMFKVKEEDISAFVASLRERAPNVHHISLTGGEPLQQNEKIIGKLVESLANRSFIVQLETSGQIVANNNETVKTITEKGYLSIDLKTPSSRLSPNMEAITSMFKAGYRASKVCIQLKAVVADDADYEFTKKAFNELMPHWPKVEYIITPCWEPNKEMALSDFAEDWFNRFLADTEWHCLPKVILQQHKVMFGTDNEDS